MSSETHAPQAIEGSLSSTDTHVPLSLVLFNTSTVNDLTEMVKMVSKELFETLTIRSLLHLCTACKQTPTAPMLAIALQNSVPSLTGLPMDNPDPGFYLEIAKRWFDPAELTIEDRVYFYNRVHRLGTQEGFFYPDTTDVYAPLGDLWPHGLDFFVDSQINQIRNNLVSKKKRAFVRGMMLEWKAVYEKKAPGDVKYPIFIDKVVSVLDYAHLLCHRRLTPGHRGSSFVGKDEHM